MRMLWKELKEPGGKVYRTDRCGEIELKISKSGKIKVKKFIDSS